MRRKDRQVSGPDFYDYVFKHATELFLAVFNGDWPYCLPLNYARDGNKLYLHSAREGLKLACIRRNGNVAFSLATDMEIDTRNSTTYYKSICGTGHASIVQDREEKRMALGLIAKRYGANCAVPAPDSDINRVDIIRIDMRDFSGKQCLPPAKS